MTFLVHFGYKMPFFRTQKFLNDEISSFFDLRFESRRYNNFNFARDLVRPRRSRAMRLYTREPLKVNHHPAKSGGHRHLPRSLSKLITTLPSLVVIGTVVVEI